MQTCKAQTPQRGFSYLLLLFALLLSSVAAARMGPQWQVLQQREREAELLFRGHEIRKAVESYRAVVVDGASSLPPDLQSLVEDRRLPEPRHHLRRLYVDPFTGKADWLLLTEADGGISGVRSRSRVPALGSSGQPVSAQAAPGGEPGGAVGDRRVRVGDWLFAAAPAASASE